MISFLSSPKSFAGLTGAIQKNAIRSWRQVHPDAEVIIYGDSPGAAEACRELDVKHVPDIPCSPSGVPYFNGIVEHAKEHARHDTQVYLNCDIIMNGAIAALPGIIGFPDYLVVGQRIDLAEGVMLEMSSGRWKEELLRLAGENKAGLHPPSGMDYFVFNRGMWRDLLPLVIGRGGYDSALAAFCLRRRIPLIDGTFAIPAIHQFHDYKHVSGEKSQIYQGPDAADNLRVHNIKHSLPNTADAKWKIVRGKLTRSCGRVDWLRRTEMDLRFVKGLEAPGLALRALWRVLVGLGLYKLRQPDIYEVLRSY